jgi:HlyD family secretion protein
LYLSFDVSKYYGGGEWKITLPNKAATNYSTNLNAYNTALQNREQALVNASTSVVNATLSFNQTVAGARPEDIASAKATLDSATLAYENTIVRAPFAGQIGSVSAAVGQQTNSQAGIATILTKDKIAEIKLNEIDIVNVKLGQSVDLSFEAIPGEKFKGTVSQIDTVGISASNVVSFAVKISIPNADERIKSGMSVTAEIIIEGKENILTVPSSTIKIEKIKGENTEIKHYVMKAVNNNDAAKQQEKIYVVVGMTNNIDTEILEGLSEGDKVLSKTNNETTATKQTTSVFSLFGAPGGGGTRAITGGGGGGQRTGGNTR